MTIYDVAKKKEKDHPWLCVLQITRWSVKAFRGGSWSRHHRLTVLYGCAHLVTVALLPPWPSISTYAACCITHGISIVCLYIASTQTKCLKQEFTMLSGVKPYKYKWHVQMKLIHSWKQNPPYADETLEIVLKGWDCKLYMISFYKNII